MLQGWGEVTSVRLPKDNHSGNYRGFAFVEFKLPQSVTVRVLVFLIFLPPRLSSD
jgi:hypothetical protein